MTENGVSERFNVVLIAHHIGVALANEVAHRDQHARRFQPAGVARYLASKFGERVGGVIVVQCRLTCSTVVEHPCVSAVVRATVALHVGRHGLEAIRLPTHPRGTAVEEGHVGTPESQGFKRQAVRGDGVEFDVQPRGVAEVVGELLWIFVKGGVIVLHRKGDAQCFFGIIASDAPAQARHQHHQNHGAACYFVVRFPIVHHHFHLRFRAPEKSPPHKV